MSYLVVAVALVLAVGAGGCAHAPAGGGGGPPPASSPSRVLGHPVAAFRRPTVQGPVFDSQAAAGRLLVVDFFAAYCAPCQHALPELEQLHRTHPEVTVVGISLDEDAVVARRQVARHRLTFPVVHDPGNALAGRFRVTELPITFVVDGAGKVAWVGGPEQRPDMLKRAINALAKPPNMSKRRIEGIMMSKRRIEALAKGS